MLGTIYGATKAPLSRGKQVNHRVKGILRIYVNSVGHKS